MVESSFPLFRVGAAAIPDSIFITRQRMIPWRCLTLTPPFLNPPSLGTFHLPGGSLWLVPGPAALIVSEGCPSGSRSCPRALYVPWPAQRPLRPAPCGPCYCAFWQSISFRPSSYLGHRGGTPVVVSTCHSSCRNARLRVLPGGTPWPGMPSVSTRGWLAPSRLAATGYELWCWPS